MQRRGEPEAGQGRRVEKRSHAVIKGVGEARLYARIWNSGDVRSWGQGMTLSLDGGKVGALNTGGLNGAEELLGREKEECLKRLL